MLPLDNVVKLHKRLMHSWVLEACLRYYVWWLPGKTRHVKIASTAMQIAINAPNAKNGSEAKLPFFAAWPPSLPGIQRRCASCVSQRTGKCPWSLDVAIHSAGKADKS